MAPNLGNLLGGGWTQATSTPTYPKGSWGNYEKPKPKLSRSERRKLKRKLNLNKNGKFRSVFL